jgi:hypothetical protein
MPVNRRVKSLSDRTRAVTLSALLVVLVAGIYLQTLRFGFVFDDFGYVPKSRLVAAGMTWDGVRASFSEIRLGFWHPLTTLSLMLDTSVFGPDPAG